MNLLPINYFRLKVFLKEQVDTLKGILKEPAETLISQSQISFSLTVALEGSESSESVKITSSKMNEL